MTISTLQVGLQGFHNGVPVELLYRVRLPNVWLLRPLFVEGEDHEEIFVSGDTFTLLHTKWGANYKRTLRPN